MIAQELTAARLREVLAYDPETGVFVWLVRAGPRAAVGSVAGWSDGKGYLRTMVDKKEYKAHRLAWLHVHGMWPTGQIDHIDGNPSNNWISNLRDVSQSTNMQNLRRAHSSNKSCGLLGVAANRGRWQARIRIDGKLRHIGMFDTPELAHEAYVSAKRRHHPGGTI